MNNEIALPEVQEQDKQEFCPFDPERADSLILLVQEGLDIVVAARALNILEGHVRFWQATHKDFARALESAQAQVERRALRVILTAIEEKGDVKAAQWLLETRFPERWGKQGQRDNPLSGMSPQEIATTQKYAMTFLREMTMVTKKSKK